MEIWISKIGGEDWAEGEKTKSFFKSDHPAQVTHLNWVAPRTSGGKGKGNWDKIKGSLMRMPKKKVFFCQAFF